MNKRLITLCGSGVLAMAGAAQAATITFDDIPAGSFVGSQYFSQGVLIAADNSRAGGPDVATTFDSNQSSPWDTDLEYPWESGNLAGQRLNNLLIIAENVTDSNGDGFIDQPDDEGEGGRLFFSFNRPLRSFGLDVIDLEVVGNQGTLNSEMSAISFYNDGALLRTVQFSEFTDSSSPFYDPSIEYGRNTANRIEPITAREVGSDEFDSVVVYLNKSHAIDTISYEVVPEPTALAFALGLPALAMFRRRRA